MIKKIAAHLILLIIIYAPNVFAKLCTATEIRNHQTEIRNVTYNLEYNPDYRDINGTQQIGYFVFSPVNLPKNYQMLVEDTSGIYFLKNGETCALNGGIYKIQIKYSACDNVISTYEIRIPFYKQYCDLEKECTQVWDDGTKDITEIPEIDEPLDKDFKLDIKVVVAISSIIVIFITTFTIIKVKRRKNI